MRTVFVFGSNLAGRHGKGAALDALRHWGAIYGQGEGLQGSSYAIPTKDARLRTLPLEVIAGHVETFLTFAATSPTLKFLVTPIGCGLAGYTPPEIAPMFIGANSNVHLPRPFLQWFKDCRRWRGTVLTGRLAHWCHNWDGLPVDETSHEWPCPCAAELRADRLGR